jgi:hypothetical protein
MSTSTRVSQIDLVRHAERLAASLRSPTTVSRSAVSKLVGTFRQDGDREAFQALLEAIAAGRGGDRERGAGFSEQIDHASQQLLAFIEKEEGLSSRELQGVLGWTERLMTVAEILPAPAPARSPRGREPGSGGGRRPSRLEAEPPARTREPGGPKLGGLGGRNLAVLAALKKDNGAGGNDSGKG